MKTAEVRIVRWGDLTDQDIAAWDVLELRSLDQNVYLSPHFVIPALRHLERSDDVIAVLIEERSVTNSDLIGFCLFEPVSGTRRFPLPHLRALQTRHSFKTCLLLDPERAAQAIQAFLDWSSGRTFPWHGIYFEFWPLTDAGNLLLQHTCTNRHIPFTVLDQHVRAMLIPADVKDDYLQKQLSANRIKQLQRQQRRLSGLGEYRWKAYTGHEITEEIVQRFLDLEHMGWKGDEGSSLKSFPANEQFFRSMTHELAQRGRATFTEISVGDRVISSTCNFLSGNVGFAFKLGWDPAYAKYSPGILNEIEIVRQSPRLFSTMTSLDSGATEGSFMAQIWACKQPIGHILISTSRLSRLTLFAYGIARAIKHRFFQRKESDRITHQDE